MEVLSAVRGTLFYRSTAKKIGGKEYAGGGGDWGGAFDVKICGATGKFLASLYFFGNNKDLLKPKFLYFSSKIRFRGNIRGLLE